MIRIDQLQPFQASWNTSNRSINPNCDGTLKKVKNLFFYIPNLIVATCINPRKASKFYPTSNLNSNEGSFNKEVITPDQVHLAAAITVVKNATIDTPTVILFNPLNTKSSIHDQLQYQLVNRECNVVTFEYRGLGNTRRAEDLVVDGESIFQYVTQELGTRSDKVHFFGFSLGGALAAQVKALHPESCGKYVGDRPFKSIFSFITENCCIVKLGGIIKKITSFAAAIFFAYPIYLLGWEWDGAKSLSLMQGEVRVIYHPNDWLIPFDAGLASQCTSEQRICLDPNKNGPSTHFSPIEYQSTEDGQEAILAVADFLEH